MNPAGTYGLGPSGPGNITSGEQEISLTERIRACVRSIPPGRITTYGRIAAMAGNPRASRAVVWALRSVSKSNPRGPVPWHRVVNRLGTISDHDGRELQRALLDAEGVEFSSGGKIDLTRFGWP